MDSRSFANSDEEEWELSTRQCSPRCVVASLENAQEFYGLDDTVHGLFVMLHDPYQAEWPRSEEVEDSEQIGTTRLFDELAPRVAAAALSVFALNTLACALAGVLTYTIFFGFTDAGFELFTRVVANVFDETVLAGFMLKCLLFGLAVALIPIATGLEAERGQPRSVPFAVLAGLVKLFFVIGIVAVLSLVVKYI